MCARAYVCVCVCVEGEPESRHVPELEFINGFTAGRPRLYTIRFVLHLAHHILQFYKKGQSVNAVNGNNRYVGKT